MNILNLVGNRIMDLYDQRILEMLSENSRISNTEIAIQLNISEGTVRRRINQLIENGIITRFTIETMGP